MTKVELNDKILNLRKRIIDDPKLSKNEKFQEEILEIAQPTIIFFINYIKKSLLSYRISSFLTQEDYEQALKLEIIEKLPDYDGIKSKLNTFIYTVLRYKAENLIAEVCEKKIPWETLKRYNNIKNSYIKRGLEKTCKIYNLSEARVLAISSMLDGSLNIDTPIKHKDDSLSLHEVVSDKTKTPSQKTMERVIKNELSKELHRCLTDVQYDVVCKRIGFGNYNTKQKYGEIAKENGYCAERNRQIFNESIQVLRRNGKVISLLQELIAE